MNVNTWLKSTFSKKSTPNWECPSCSKGLLKIKSDEFHFEETRESLGWHDRNDWEPEYIRYRFHGTLKCSECQDFISFSGLGNVEYYHFYDEYRMDYVEGYKDVFYPEYFNPPLNLFKIHQECPWEIRSEIRDSFNLFWFDLPSCANKIRTSLEMLMNYQKVPKTFLQNGKRKKLTLHKRIERFKNKKPEIADYLLAIKWIGNIGSHIGELEKIDILETYQLLEYSLNKLYDNDEEKLNKISNEIIKRKGKRKR